MARPQNIHSYLKNHNRIANDMVNVIQQKFSSDSDNELSIPNFEQIIKLLTLECKFLFEYIFENKKHHDSKILVFLLLFRCEWIGIRSSN